MSPAAFALLTWADAGNWYLKPLADINVTHLDLGDAHEHGASTASLDVQWRGQDRLDVLSRTRTSEASCTFPTDLLLQPYLRGGATVFSETDFGLLASFDGTPAGVAPFAIDSKIDRVLGVVSVGVDAFTAGGATLKLSYDGPLRRDHQRQQRYGPRQLPVLNMLMFSSETPHIYISAD